MKIVVEINDFFLEEEEIEQSLKQFVIQSCVQSIKKQIDKKIEDQIERQVKLLIEKEMTKQIQDKVSEFVETAKVKYSSEMVSVPEYIKKNFENNSGWSSPKDQIMNLAKKFGDEMKQRYDLLFASQIVAKLNENGLLKEDAAKVLLESFKK